MSNVGMNNDLILVLQQTSDEGFWLVSLNPHPSESNEIDAFRFRSFGRPLS